MNTRKYEVSAIDNDLLGKRPGKAVVCGTFHTTPDGGWSNGFLIEFRRRPWERDECRNIAFGRELSPETIAFFAGDRFDEAADATMVARVSWTPDGDKKPVTVVMFRSAAHHAYANEEYVRMFTSRYPACRFALVGTSSAIAVRDACGKLAGAVMPMFLSGTEANEAVAVWEAGSDLDAGSRPS